MHWFRRRSSRKVTTSLAPTTPNQRSMFAWLGGRRVIADAPYMLPTDFSEVNRLDFQHFMLRFALRGNYIAPLQNPLAILDVGCGTGRWALEMAERWPEANVVGVDLTPPQVDAQSRIGHTQPDRRPENYTFVIGNVLQGLPFADNTFDFVHQRLLYAAIPRPQWPEVIAELYRVAKPGGWVELVEGSLGAHTDGPAMQQLAQWIIAATSRRDIDMRISPHLPGYLRDAGFRDVRVREEYLPIGKHHGHLGQMVETDLLGVVSGLRGPIVAAGLTDLETYNATVAAWQKEIPLYHSSWPIYVIDGQK